MTNQWWGLALSLSLYFWSHCNHSSPTTIVQILFNPQLDYSNSLLDDVSPSSPVFPSLSCISITSGNIILLLKILLWLLTTHRLNSQSLSRAYKDLFHLSLAYQPIFTSLPTLYVCSHNIKLLGEQEHTMLFLSLCLWSWCHLSLECSFSPLHLAGSSVLPILHNREPIGDI